MTDGSSRRDVLRGGALGVSALVGAMGLGAAFDADAAAAVAGDGSVRYYLKLDGVAGTSTDPGHAGEIPVVSFAWGAEAATSTGGGGGAGKVTPDVVSVQAGTGPGSPVLLQQLVLGRHIASAVLSARKDGAKKDLFVFSFEEVVLATYQIAGSNAHYPLDSMSFNFRRVTFAYGTISFEWDTGRSV